MRIRRIEIRGYRGIHELVADIPTRGITIVGTNGSGKTSVVRGVQTAVAGGDCGPDAIRHGEERAELVVFTDHERIRRLITERAATLTVTRTEDGAKLPSPQKRLDAAAGPLLDPLAFATEKTGAERQALIRRAIPATLTADEWHQVAPDLPAGFDLSGHPLEAFGRMRKHYATERTAAGANAKRLEADATRAAEEVAREAAAIPTGTPAVAEVAPVLEEAAKRVARFEAEAVAAERQVARSEATRRRVDSLQEGAARLRAEAASDGFEKSHLEAAGLRCEELEAQREVIQLQLRAVEDDIRTALLVLQDHRREHENHRARLADAASREQQAADLAATLADVGAAPPAAEVEAARAEVAHLQELRRAAEHAEYVGRLRVQAERIAEEAKRAQAEHTRLERVVQGVDEAPAKLLAGRIPAGLELRDGDIWLDGIRFDRLCGFEQLGFAVDVAKRLAGEARFLVLDGLESVAEDNLDALLERIGRGGWQLIASHVKGGEFRLVDLDGLPIGTAAPVGGA